MDSNNEEDTSECQPPPFQRKALPPSLYPALEGVYSVGENSVTLFSLMPEMEEHTQDPPTEITLSDVNPEMCDDETPTPLVYWSTAGGGAVHSNAVQVSTDLDGGPLFVGRAFAEGELLPGKIAVLHQVCYVAYEGKELPYHSYEVLVLERGLVEWVECKDGAFPAHALHAGLTLQGKVVYCARAPVSNIMTPGMLVSGEKKCRISYDMKEYTFSEYEVLAVRSLNPKKFQGALRHVPAPK